jgi:hypothetical protein
MGDSQAKDMGELSDIVTRIQGIDVDKISNDSVARADLLHLANKLTVALEGPINRATDLAFKVNF